jgi:hypothetical protein
MSNKSSKPVLGFVFVALVSVLAHIPSASVPATKTWDGGGATSNWSEAANWSDDLVPGAADTVIFDGTSTRNATIDTDIVVDILNVHAGYSGTISQGSSNVTVNGQFRQLAGTFSAGGTFTFSGSPFERGAAATFTHNNGTVVFSGSRVEIRIEDVTATQEFGNLTLDLTDLVGSQNDTLRVAGTLNLNRGSLHSVKVEAIGPVNVAGTWGNGSDAVGEGEILLSGPATRTIQLPALPNLYNAIELNAPNTTVNLTGTGEARFKQLRLIAGAFHGGTSNFRLNSGGGGSQQSGGILDCGSGGVAFDRGDFTQTGGAFNCQRATVNGTLSARLMLNGGIFNAPTGTMTWSGGDFYRGAGGTFNHNNGTLILSGEVVQIRIVDDNLPTRQEFGNLTVTTTQGLFGGGGDPLVVTGNLVLGGSLISANVAEVQGNVTIHNGAFSNGPLNLTLSGTRNQTYIHDGGANPFGSWTIDKPSGTVTLATSLVFDRSDKTLNIASGTLYLNSNANLTVDRLFVGAHGRLVNESATTITLGGNVSNSGVIDLQGGGAACPGADTILIRSSDATQRSWGGPGRYRLVDVDVQNMGGISQKEVFSGTNSGNNGPGWVFDANCPVALSITPSVVGVQTGTTQTFTAGGGSTPYAFNLSVNGSGGTINASSGAYTAGATAGATDVVRVKDAFGTEAKASITTFDTPARLVFTAQPGTTVAGVTLAPAVQVAIQDQFGNTITNSGVAVTIAIPNSAGNPSPALAGTLTRNAVNGVALFADLSIDRAGVGYTLRAVANPLTAATSGGFDVVAGAATRLAFVVQPSNTRVGSLITPAVELAVQDEYGNATPGTADEITLSLGNNPSGGTLSGALPRPAVSGVATFTGLNIDRFGQGYTLVATSGLLAPATSHAFTVVDLVVTNTNDSGVGSLRQAIIDAQAPPFRAHTISFSIPGVAPFTITPASPLPNIRGSVSIDGTTQPGFAGTPIVELDGTNAGAFASGLTFYNARESTVRGLVINRFAHDGIGVESSSFTTIQGNYIGTDVSGNEQRGNKQSAIDMGESSYNLVGGTTPAARNVLSGNTRSGIGIRGVGSLYNVVQGNFIGTNAAGTAAIPNGIGVSTFDSSRTIIGGTEGGAGNIISGNSETGIRIGLHSLLNDVWGNRIGTNVNGVSAVPNGDGVTIDLGSLGVYGSGQPVLGLNHVGGASHGEANLIAFNRGNGIRVVSGPGNRLRGNSLHSNGSLGIDIADNGITPNDAQDTDGGSNGSQNHPVLTRADIVAGETVVQGSFNSTPSRVFTLDFYSSAACDASARGEGEIYVGSGAVMTEPYGPVPWNVRLATLVAGKVITATATDGHGNTSEFSNCVTVGARNAILGRLADSSNQPFANATVTVTGSETRTTLTNSHGEYAFDNLLQGGHYTVTPGKANFAFTPANRVFNNFSANQTDQDFTGARTAFRVSGQVMSETNGASFALEGVMLALSGAGSPTTQTDAFGKYSFNDVPMGGQTITPTKAGFAFNPASTFINVTADRTADFAAGVAVSVSGRILTGAVGGGLHAMNADGSNDLAVFGGAGFCNQFPCQRLMDGVLSPDGSRIAFIEATISGNVNVVDYETIFVANFDGTNKQPVLVDFQASDSSRLGEVSWSPDSTRLVFVKDGIRTINLDSTNLSQQLAVGQNPQWSPDGTTILFSARPANVGNFGIPDAFNIQTVRPDGTNRVRLTSGFFDFAAVWSPDGTRIAFIRRPALHSLDRRIFTMNADGTNQAAITTGADYAAVLWSPDGTKLAFKKSGSLVDGMIVGNIYGVMNPDGSDQLNIKSFYGAMLSWAPIFSPPTPPGSNVTTIVGGVSITFNGVATGGLTTVTPVSGLAAGQLPDGFILTGGLTFEVTTTALVRPPITVCFTFPANTSSSTLNSRHFLHNEGGILIDRTSSRDFSTKQVCATVNSLSPFAIAERIDATLPRIAGLLRDNTGEPLVGVSVALTGSGDLTTQTDSQGLFSFVNLTAGGNYNVQPKHGGYLFSESNQDFIAVNGEQTVIFTGTAAAFSLSGRVADADGNGAAGVELSVAGSASTVTTDDDGFYAFGGLPAGVDYIVTAFKTGFESTPRQVIVQNLSGNQTEVNFTLAVSAPPPTPTSVDTTMALVSSANPVTVGEAVTFTATASPAAGSIGVGEGTTTITVTGIGVSLTETKVGPTASLTPPALALGAYTVVATYGGSVNFNASTATIQQVVSACPSTLVTNLNDNGPGSLRELIRQACNGATISFDPAVRGTLTLTSGVLLIDKNLIVNGPGANVLTVSANRFSRVLHITAGRTVTLSGLTVADGNAHGSGVLNDGGGGILNDRGALTINDSAVTGNTAASGGGIFNLSAGDGSVATLTISRSTISGNTSTGHGGGIASDGRAGGSAILAVTNSTIARNTAFSGGALHNSATRNTVSGVSGTATLTITNSTLAGNDASDGGIVSRADVPGSAAVGLGNTLLFGNTPRNLVTAGGTITSWGHNLSGDAAGGDGTAGPGGFLNQPGDLRSTDPRLELDGNNQLLLRNNGGPTMTMGLRCGSPAIDAGTNVVTDPLGLNLTTDQRGTGFPRRAGASVDIGAFESQAACAAGDMSGDGFVRDDDARYQFSLRARQDAQGESAQLSVRIDGDGRKKKDPKAPGRPRDDRFESRTVTFIAFSDDPTIRPGQPRRPQVDSVLFRGMGEWNGQGGYRYEAFAQDQTEPRLRESVRVTIWSPAGTIVAAFDGELDGGNVRSKRIKR